MEFDLYPEKPSLTKEKPKHHIAVTAFSIVLFILTFLFIFSGEVNFIFHLVLVLIVHELGHFLMMKLFGYQNVRMLFIPLMGAFVQGSKRIYSQRQSLLVTGIGPFPGIVIGGLLIFTAARTQTTWMVDLGLLFLFLNILNLLPLDPLDGGQLFKLLIRRKQDLFLLVFSFVSSMILIGFGWFTQSWLVMVFGFLMGFRVRGLQRQYHLRKQLDEEGIIYERPYDLLSNRDFYRIKHVILQQNDQMRNYIDYLNQEDADQLMAQQVNAVLRSPLVRDAGILFKLILIGFWLAAFIAPFVLLLTGTEWITKHYTWYFEYLSSK